MKKKIISLVAVIVLIVCAVSLSACDNATEGKSAYDLAVENGFQGTLDEWLESLKGTDGKDGVDGKDGKDGTNGMDGTNAVAEITVSDVYEQAAEDGYKGTKMQFLKEYVTSDVTEEQSNIAKNLLSSVAVVCTHEVAVTYYWSGTKTGSASSAGSGVIYRLDKEKGDAYVITNYHVVYNSSATTADKISNDIGVYLYGSYTSDQKITAKYVGGSMNYDVAVLKIEGSELLKNSSAQAVTFADSNDVAVGETAIAIGNAEGNGISATKGIVSVDSESLEMTGADDKTKVTFRVMRIDCAVNEGNSGGGLFDGNGKLIGIVNAKVMTDDVENIGYALPSNVVKYVTENIIYNASQNYSGVKKALLGITVQSKNPKAVYDANACKTLIEEEVTVYEDEKTVIEKSALAYGHLYNGDIIKSVSFDYADDEEGYEDEVTITRSYQIVDLMLTVKPGDKIKIVVDRPNTEGENTTYEETVVELTITEKCVSAVA